MSVGYKESKDQFLLLQRPQLNSFSLYWWANGWTGCMERSLFATSNCWWLTIDFTAICIDSIVCSLCGVLGSSLEEKNCAYHTLVRYKAFEGDRETLIRRIRTCAPLDLVHCMLKFPGVWEGKGGCGGFRQGGNWVQGGS